MLPIRRDRTGANPNEDKSFHKSYVFLGADRGLRRILGWLIAGRADARYEVAQAAQRISGRTSPCAFHRGAGDRLDT